MSLKDAQQRAAVTTHLARRAIVEPGAAYRHLKRRYSPSLYIERNHDHRHTLFLVGSGRSGSTWLSEILVEALHGRFIFEPFRRDQIPLARNIRWGQYIDPDTSDQALKNVVRQILEGRIRLQWTDIHNTHRLPRTRLVKEIRATNLLPWVVREFLDMPVVYLLRHPLAASWSAAELGWKSRLSEFLVQVPLIEGPLRRYK